MSGLDPPRRVVGVVAVITAHNPDERLARLVAQVDAQVAQVVVVDDGSTTGTQMLADVETSGARVLRQPNAGVAAALNAGVREALADAATDAVLTLDQDSGVPEGYLAAAVSAWQQAVAAGIPVAFVSAASYSGHAAPTRGERAGFGLAFDPMQSGSLVPATTYREVGYYDAGLVIDAVDSEFTVRCLGAGLVPVVGPGCGLEHGQGERLPALLGGRPVRVRGRQLAWNRHSAGRVYYMARNGTLLTRRHLRGQPGWVLRRLVEEGRAHLLRLAFSPDRLRLTRAAAAGVRDGLLGRTGPVPGARAAQDRQRS